MPFRLCCVLLDMLAVNTWVLGPWYLVLESYRVYTATQASGIRYLDRNIGVCIQYLRTGHGVRGYLGIGYFNKTTITSASSTEKI